MKFRRAPSEDKRSVFAAKFFIKESRDQVEEKRPRMYNKEPDYNLVLTSYGDSRPDLLFHAMAEQQSLDHLGFASRKYEPFDLEEGLNHFINLGRLEIIASAAFKQAHHLLTMMDGDTLMMIRVNKERIALEAAGKEPLIPYRKCEELFKTFPFELLKKSKDRIPIYFWGEGSSMSRSIPIVKWDPEMRINYSKEIVDNVEAAINQDLPKGLIIWHGVPGTGKTWALRSLISEREENTVHYITDPEVLVRRADYMYDILGMASRHDGPDGEEKETLIICEDSGPLVTDESGMELGRILNLADGILGQGFNLRLLFTTNDPINRFHPAVLRPGRCAQELEFTELSKEEANAWCDYHDKPRINQPQTLAWLYANVVEERQPEAVGQYL